jgi:hypothetical protein
VPGSRRGRCRWATGRGALLFAIATAVAPRPAAAAEVTRVVSALDDDNRFDFNLTLSWLHDAKTAFIKREAVVTRTGPNGDSLTRSELIKDLQYVQTRNVLNLRADFGVLWDVGIHIEAPIVLGDDRRLDFDQSQGPDCHYPGELNPTTQQEVTPTCVNASNSTVLRDRILPVDPAANPVNYGIDAQHPGRSYAGEPTVFRGPSRRGIEYLGFGINWAAFNQARDDTKPTWTLGFDARLDVGKDMRFDPLAPGANTAVGLGYHQLIWSTMVSKRFRSFDPYFGLYYMLPVRTNGSPYQRYGTGGQTAVDPQQRAGVQIGVEQIAWEKPSAQQRVTVEVRGRMDHHFYGRSHSELWEALSGSPQCASDASKCRSDPNVPGGAVGIDFDSGNPSPYPGVSETQAYTTFGGDAGLNIQVGRYIRFRGLFGLALELPHFITYANAGVDRDGDNAVQLANPAEKNPAYREIIDNPGRRFRVEGTRIWSLLLEGALMF